MLTTVFWVVAILIAILVFLLWSPHYKNLGTERLPEVMRDLMINKQNGGYFKLNFKGGKRWITVERIDGTDESAVVAIRIPLDLISEDRVAEVRDTLVAYGFEWQDESDGYSLVAIAMLTIDDIWPRDSGEKLSMAIMSVVHASNMNEPVRYDIQSWGKYSKRRYKRASYV